MSLTRSLTRSLVKPLVSPLGGDTQAIIDARESLVVKYPLKSDLNSDPAGSQGVLTSSQKIYRDALGKWVVADPNSPAVTGISTLLESDSENMCTSPNADIEDGDESTLTPLSDVTVSVVDASSSLSEQGFSDLIGDGTLSGSVYRAINSNASGRRIVRIGGVNGSAGTFSASLIVRQTGGNGVASNFGLRVFQGDGSSGVNVALEEGVWTFVKSEDKTTASASSSVEIQIPSLATVDFFLFQQEMGSISTSPIIVDGSSATRLADDLQLPTTGWPVNDCTLFFCGYNLRDIGSNQTLFESNNIRIYFDDSSNHFIADVGGSQSIINGFDGQNCVAQLANNITLSESADGFYYNFKVFDSLVSIDSAVWA